MTATLTWTEGATDLDLYLVRGGNILAMSLQAPPTVTETVTATVPAGNYSLAVHYGSFNPPGPGLRQRCSPAQTCPAIPFSLTVTRPR